MNKENKLPVTDFIAVDRYAGKNDYNVPDYDSEELKKEFKSDILHRAMPSTRMINEILHKMGKTTPEQELNCGSCGYDTCREKAIQQINNAACEIMNIKNSSDILNSPVVRVLNPTEYLNVMDTKRNVHDKKVYLAEYGKYVEETIIYDPDYHMIMSIMRDITAEENEREKRNKITTNTIEVTDKVIEKQMRTVQEIASLLGETVAETKVALTNLKESLGDE